MLGVDVGITYVRVGVNVLVMVGEGLIVAVGNWAVGTGRVGVYVGESPGLKVAVSDGVGVTLPCTLLLTQMTIKPTR